MKHLFLMLCFLLTAINANAKKLDITFQQHINNLKKELSDKGYDASILDKVFNNNFVTDKAVTKSLKNQPEVKFSFDKYVNGKLSEWRIKTGKKLYTENYTFLKTLEDKYNVDPAVMIALWGLETNYGTYPLKHNAIKALTNMSYTHSRQSRREYFKNELFDVFELTKKFDLDPLELKGSWAGALGQCQFMPSNVLKYAVDGNNDGKVDIWNTTEDILASSANFVKTLGWVKASSNILEISVPKNFNILQKRNFKHLATWKNQGVSILSEGVNTHNEDKMKLFAPKNVNNKVFLVSKNFDVIKKWNNSDYFAFSVLSLANEIKK